MFAIELMQAASKYSNTIKLVSGCTSSNPPECIGDGHYVSSFSSAIAGGTTVVSFMAGQGYEVTLSQPLEDMIPAGTMIYFSPAPFSGDGTWMFGVPLMLVRSKHGRRAALHFGSSCPTRCARCSRHVNAGVLVLVLVLVRRA